MPPSVTATLFGYSWRPCLPARDRHRQTPNHNLRNGVRILWVLAQGLGVRPAAPPGSSPGWRLMLASSIRSATPQRRRKAPAPVPPGVGSVQGDQAVIQVVLRLVAPFELEHPAQADALLALRHDPLRFESMCLSAGVGPRSRAARGGCRRRSPRRSDKPRLTR